jgi:hypothetical protein
MIMSKAIHISTMRKMLQSADPVDLVVWTKKGEIQYWNNVVSLKYDHYLGVRNVKFLDSGQIRKVRDVCIYSINNMIVFL